MDALAPPVTWADVTATLPARTEARGERRLRAGLLGGCVQRVFFPNVNGATVRVLAAEGVEVVVPEGQGCCGALSVHAGRDEEARRLARDLVERFERAEVDVVVVNAAGCGSHLKDLAELFRDDPAFLPRAQAFAERVRDVSEVLATLPPRAPRGPVRARVAYHSPCHLGHAQRIVDAPRALLRAIPGLELVEVPDGEQCCGSAGIYNIVQPRSADEIGRRKAAAVVSTKATLIASANPGCSLQIRRMLEEVGAPDVEAAHPVEILDRSISGPR
jgi:glycolate oxidase iron-sulfur subunit